MVKRPTTATRTRLRKTAAAKKPAAGKSQAGGKSARRGKTAKPSREAKPAAPRRATGAVAGVEIRGKSGPRYDEVLSAGALRFLAGLHRQFEGTRLRLLAARTA